MSDTTFIDRMGDFFDTMGQPRIAGKVFGYLLICDPPEQNARQIRDAVAASVGSVNTTVRMLESAGFVERRGESGSRRLWYRIAPGAFSRVLALRMQLVTQLRSLAETELAEIGDRGERSHRLIEMRDCYAFFEREFPALLEKYAETLEAAP